MAIELNTQETASRLEEIQRKRLAAIEKIEKDDPQFIMDSEMAITYSTLLRDIEKQELYKHKHESDKEDTQTAQEIARQALEMEKEIRRQRREGILTQEVDEHSSIPTFNKEEVGEEADNLATLDKVYVQQDWSEFRRKMIAEGKDPNYYIDENGNIAQREKEDENKG